MAWGGSLSAAALSPQVRWCPRCRREAARARRTEPMLDLEVVPERSLGNEQWEFTLGECGGLSGPGSLALTWLWPFPLWSLSLMPQRPRLLSAPPLVFRLPLCLSFSL